MKQILTGLCIGSVCAAQASADVTMQFVEGAPKDRFTLTNEGTCPLVNLTVVLDLSGSSAGLIFDVTAAGAGVDVFQPLQIVEGAGALADIPQVKDGDTAVALPIRRLDAGASISFTIDVDDTSGQREITVSGSEIAGAAVRLADLEAWFDETSVATLGYQACLS